MPSLSRTLAYVQRRDKPDEPALRLVREALLTLRDEQPAHDSASDRRRRHRKPRRRA
jgi:hypothetical protein